MNLNDRDRRALLLLGAAVLVTLAVYFWPAAGSTNTIVSASNSPEFLERRLQRARQLSVTVPDKQAALRQAQADLAVRERGLLQADTAAQAQAQLFQILRRVGRAQSPQVEIRATEIGQAKPFGKDYGEVSVGVSMDCGIGELVQLLADLSAQPELLATSELRIGAANGNQKQIPVRLVVSGIVNRKLIPEKKSVTF